MALASIDAQRAVRTAGRTLLTSIAQQPSSPARSKEARESPIPLKQVTASHATHANPHAAYDLSDSRASSRGLPNQVRRLRSLHDSERRASGTASAPVPGLRFRRTRMAPMDAQLKGSGSACGETQMPRRQKSGYRRAQATATLCRTASEVLSFLSK